MGMSEETMNKIIDSCSTSVISSIDEDGFPNTKAMLAPRKRNGLKEFYFTTNTSSLRVDQYKNNSKSCIYFYDANKFQGLMIVGEMEVIFEKDIKEMIWKNGDELYYPKGSNDPDYCVLKFVGKKIRTYHSFQKEEIKI